MLMTMNRVSGLWSRMEEVSDIVGFFSRFTFLADVVSLSFVSFMLFYLLRLRIRYQKNTTSLQITARAYLADRT